MSNELHFAYIYDYENDIGFGSEPPQVAPKIEKSCKKICDSLNEELEDEARSSFSKDLFVFHSLKQSGTIFLCFSSNNSNQRLVYGMLESIADDPEFISTELSETQKGTRYLQGILDQYNEPEFVDFAQCKTNFNEDMVEVEIENLDEIFKDMMNNEIKKRLKKEEEEELKKKEKEDEGEGEEEQEEEDDDDNEKEEKEPMEDKEKIKRLIVIIIISISLFFISCVIITISYCGCCTLVLGLLIGLILNGTLSDDEKNDATKQVNNSNCVCVGTLCFFIVLLSFLFHSRKN